MWYPENVRISLCQWRPGPTAYDAASPLSTFGAFTEAGGYFFSSFEFSEKNKNGFEYA